MREILFKAKRLDNKEWIEGSIVHQTDFYGDIVDRWFIIDGTTTQDYDIGENIEVIPSTVCQYIGKCDKHGDKIFENDVVFIDLSTEECLYKIKYLEDETSFLAIDEKDKVLWCFAEVPNEKIKIIDNVFDSPELMEK